MSLQAVLSKLKELKLKMAELESAEEGLSPEEKDKSELAEGSGFESAEEDMGLEKNDGSMVSDEPKDGELGDDELMEMFGKKKSKPKPGMAIAISVGKSKMNPMMSKMK